MFFLDNIDFLYRSNDSDEKAVSDFAVAVVLIIWAHNHETPESNWKCNIDNECIALILPHQVYNLAEQNAKLLQKRLIQVSVDYSQSKAMKNDSRNPHQIKPGSVYQLLSFSEHWLFLWM